MASTADFKKYIAEFADFPQKGVSFKDISPLLANPHQFSLLIETMQEHIKDMDFNKIVAIDARGFLFASTLAYTLKKSLVICRKPGKLPGTLISKSYDYEYASSGISIQEDKLETNDKVLIVDDVLATGNTVLAAHDIVATKAKVSGLLFFIELDFLFGRKKVVKNTSLTTEQIISIVHY